MGNNTADELQRQAQNLNATFKDLQLLDALGRGREVEIGLRRKSRQLRGEQAAGLAASGLALDSGSALALQQEAAYVSELDIERAKTNAAREAWGLRLSGRLRRLEAEAAYAGSQGRAPSAPSAGKYGGA